MMDNSQIKNRNNGASSDSTEIDLDEIAKMIDPLDDLEENLFSSKPRVNPVRNSQISSPKKDLSHGRKTGTKKDAEEMEILTSMSSSNGQTKMQVRENNLGAWLKSREVEKGQEIAEVGNYTIRGRKRDVKNGFDPNERDKPNVVEDQDNSNLKTGLWSGDDLWSLGKSAGKTKQMAVQSPLISPVKSLKEIGANERTDSIKNSLRSPSKLPKEINVTGNTLKRQSDNQRSMATRDKKPGKFDWLGLIDGDSDDEKDKQLSLKNVSKGASLELTSNIMEDTEQSHQIVGRLNGSKGDLFDDGLQSYGHEDSKGSKDFSNPSKDAGNYKTSTNALDPKSNARKESISERLNLGIPQGALNTADAKRHQKRNVLVAEDNEALLVDADEVSRGREKEVDSQSSLTKDKSTVEKERLELTDTSGRKDGRRKGLDTGKHNEKSALGKRGSVSEENEVSSTHGYAPTLFGGPSEGSGRRRRRKQSAESAPVRGGFSTNFDPLGLFLMDDKDQIEADKNDKKSLPEWLTGAKTKSSSEQREDSVLIQGEVRMEKRNEERSAGDLEPIKEIQSEKPLTATTTAADKNAIKLSSELNETSDKGVGKEVNVGRLYEEESSGESTSRAQRNGDNELDQRRVSQESQSTSEQKHFSPTKVAYKITDEQPTAQIFKKSGTEDVHKNVLTAKKNVSNEGKRSGGTGCSREEAKEKMEEGLAKKQVFKKPTLKAKAHHRDRKDKMSDEEVEDSSISTKNGGSGNSKQFAMMERRYMRTIRDLEEKASHVEYLEDELAKLRYMEGEVEHLKAIAHVLELEKEAAETLVVNLQERHAGQIKRLEEVHRNEVETLNNALLREEKRGAEEVRRLAEDHRKTLDRLMEANVRLEEEFRNRMQEARRDWNRDVEAMRQAYQQSSSAAITNASLAVLTGHGIGVTELKDKSESSKRDDSSVKSISQCPEEVKELSQTVERVESILIQTLEAINPKAKAQISENVIGDAEDAGQGDHLRGVIGKVHKPARAKKRVFYKVHSLGKSRKDKGIKDLERRVCSRSMVSDEYVEETPESDSSQQAERVASRSGGVDNARHYSSKGKTEDRVKQSSGDHHRCSRCHCCRQEHSCIKPFQNDSFAQGEKSDKEGRNMHEYNKEYSEENGHREYSPWGDGVGGNKMRQMNGRMWANKRQGRGSLFPASTIRLLDGNFVSPTFTPKQSSVIIDPKQYLMQLASGSMSNLFQPSHILSV